MKKLKIYFVLLLFVFISCQYEAKRNNPFDPGSNTGLLFSLLGYSNSGFNFTGSTSFAVADVRIADNNLSILTSIKLAFSNTIQLNAIDKGGVVITTGIAWSSSDLTIIAVTSNGLATSLSRSGDATITATQSSIGKLGSIKVTVSASGQSVLSSDNIKLKPIELQ